MSGCSVSGLSSLVFISVFFVCVYYVSLSLSDSVNYLFDVRERRSLR